MAEINLGQLVSTTGRARSKVLKDAVMDNHPVFQAIKENRGVRYETGGRTIVEEFKFAQNSTVKWVGEAGAVDLIDQPVIDAAEFDWKYQLGAVSFTLAEQYKNAGSAKLIDLISAKFEVLEASMMNEFHEALLGDGTGSSGLTLGGLQYLVSKTPTSGVVGGINRANADAASYRNQAFNTSTGWSRGSVDSGNVKAFLDKGINSTLRGADKVNCGILGNTHFEALTEATQAIQMITNDSGTAKVGFDKIIYRGVPMYYGGGLSFSGNTDLADDQTYLLNTKPHYLNVVFHKQAEFAMLDEQQSRDQAAVSRLMFTMANLILGYAGGQWTGFDS